MNSAPLVHWYSAQTGVSLELPSGWTQLSETPGAAAYSQPNVSHHPPELYAPRLIIKTFAITKGATAGPSEAYRVLSQNTHAAAPPESVVQAPRELQVDGQPGSRLVLHRFDATGRKLLHYQIFVQLHQHLCSITGIGEAGRDTQLLPLFDAATASIRFIVSPRPTGNVEG